MPHLDNENNQRVILELAQDAIIFDPVTPILVKIAFKGFAELPGVAVSLDAFIEKLNDFARGFVPELFELFTGFGSKMMEFV